jgi:hypothetical protein
MPSRSLAFMPVTLQRSCLRPARITIATSIAPFVTVIAIAGGNNFVEADE